MASTATNRQPLLIDRVLHYVVNMDNARNAQRDIVGTNSAILLVNSITLDGAIIEDIYAISRGLKSTSPDVGYTIHLYISDQSDFLRASNGVHIGSFTASTTTGGVTRFTEMPNILAPQAQVGSTAQLKALYIPKGYALWAAIEAGSTDTVNNGPNLGCQGGWY